jgi:exosortase
MTQPPRSYRAIRSGHAPLLGAALLAAGLVWASWPALCSMASRWSHDPRYSHGFLVPLFSLWLLWHRRAELPAMRPNWWGLSLIGLGSVIQAFGSIVNVEWAAGVSLLPTLAGISLLAGGWACLRWAGPSIAFLVFMIPLPYRAEYLLGGPLQAFATAASTYALQTLGLPAVAEGNIILIDDSRIGVVEACNGMGMLFMFFAFATAFILAGRRRPTDRVLIFLSAIPISLLANIVRITLTGFLHVTAGGKVADAFYHDMAGWLMMPLALAMLWAELALLSRLFIEPVAARGSSSGRGQGASLFGVPSRVGSAVER